VLGARFTSWETSLQGQPLLTMAANSLDTNETKAVKYIDSYENGGLG